MIPGRLPQPLQDEELITLVKRYCKEGGEDDRNKIVLHNIRLAISLAHTHAKRFPNLRDELVAEAINALMESVIRFKNIAKNYEIRRYMVTTIRYKLLSATQNQTAIQVPNRTFHRKPTVRAPTVSLTEKDWERLPILEKISRVEWDEIINLSTKTDEERIILDLSRQNYTLSEIASAVQKSISYVSKLRATLYARFRYYWLLGED